MDGRVREACAFPENLLYPIVRCVARENPGAPPAYQRIAISASPPVTVATT